MSLALRQGVAKIPCRCRSASDFEHVWPNRTTRWPKNAGDAGGALVRESGAQIACRWGWGGDFCTWLRNSDSWVSRIQLQLRRWRIQLYSRARRLFHILYVGLITEFHSQRQLRVDLSRVNSAKCSKLINCYLSLFINNKGLPIDTVAPSACRETRFIVQSWTGFLAYNSQIRIM